MIMLNITVLLVFSIITFSQCLIPMIERNESMCEKVKKKPYFETDLVVGEPWRILYTWNMNLGDKCVDTTFIVATPELVSEVWNDMYEYLEEQPIWAGATLYMTMGPSRYELLMFAQPGSAGAFTAVPNVVKKANLTPPKHSVPLLTFYLRLLKNGQFLVMIDCEIGVGSLSAQLSNAPLKEEVFEIVAELNIGEGYLACTGDKKEFLRDLVD